MASYVSVPRSLFNLFRVVGIFLMLGAWGMATNRCAIAGMTLRTQAAKAAAIHQCCPEKTSDGKEQTPDRRTGECCQGLSVLPMEVEAPLAKAPAAIVLFELAWHTPGVMLPQNGDGKARVEHRPPAARSYAELVLQRSLRNHAPPAAV